MTAPKTAEAPLMLVIDDNEEPRRAIRKMLEALVGATVMEAESSAQAFELATQHDFDLVTSDLARQPMNGHKFLAAFKNIRPNVPVIILSAVLDVGDNRERALALGAFGCLDKPFTAQQLMDLVGDALGLESSRGWRDPWA